MTEQQEMKHLDVITAPEGFDPIAAQKQLQVKIANRNEALYGDPGPIADDTCENQGHLGEIVIANVTAIQMELSELVDWLPWKWWKDYGDQHEDSIDAIATEMKYEVVDIAHFLFNIAIALGMDYQEFLDIYATKQAENHARQDRGY